MTLTQTTRLLPSSSETTRFTVLVNRVNDPVDARITAYSLVLRVYQNNFEVLICRVLIDPVGVKNTQVGAAAADTLLSCRLQGPLIFELVHTLVGWLACRSV